MDEIKEKIQIPFFGFRVNLDHVFPEKRNPHLKPSWRQLWDILPLVFRYILYYWKVYRQGRQVLMDYLKPITSQQIYGVPLGGIGCGSIGRGFRGEFCRFQLKPGMYEYNTVDPNQFIVTIQNEDQKTIFQSLLSTNEKPKHILDTWKSRLEGSKCSYTGLYPRSWTEYDLSKYGIKLVCRQVSPVIPHNYKDSSLPCAVFVWDVINVSDEIRHVTISLTWKNGTENFVIKPGKLRTEAFNLGETEGVLLDHSLDEIPLTYVLSAKKNPNVHISKMLYFEPNGPGEEIWAPLRRDGRFKSQDVKEFHLENEDLGCALAVQTTVGPMSKGLIEMCLTWHMPIVHFGAAGENYWKMYTRFFIQNHETAKIISDYALNNYDKWETEIFKWQNEILKDTDLPSWYKSAIFNETYFISDGGGVWFTLNNEEALKLDANDPRLEYGRFSYLEGHEYRMYGTYDVHFYASFALAMLWPKLQLIMQYDFRDSIFVEIPITYKTLYDGSFQERKVKDSVPHDLGDPDECPFNLINAYPIHDVSEWRDLNPKFVLQVFRDYKLNVGSTEYIKDMFFACRTVMEKSVKWDTDGDGLIENGGFPDQTYDTWVMKGPSAYCGGLWLAALRAMVEMSTDLGFTTDCERYSNLLKLGTEAYEKKLWNGSYYNFDHSDKSNTIMADQLCGYWYLSACGVEITEFPKENVASAINTIFKNNVSKFANGSLGAVNGFLPTGIIDKSSIQSMEMWTGVTYSLAALMIHEGFIQEAWDTAGGMFKSIYETLGLGFETPEALYEKHHYRAVGYMRPLSIWSMQLAWNYRKNKTSNHKEST